MTGHRKFAVLPTMTGFLIAMTQRLRLSLTADFLRLSRKWDFLRSQKKSANATVAFLLALLTPLAAQAGPQIQHWTLANGARVYFVETRALPIVDVQVDFAAGSVHGPADKVGVAGMTASLLDQGAGGLDEHAIAERLADVGAQLGASAGLERASINLRTLADPAMRKPALALMASIITAPDFPAAVVERERERAIANLKDALTRPDTVLSRNFQRALYGDHPYAWQSTPESLATIGRDDLVRFHRANYASNRASVTLVGDISRSEAEAIALQLTEKLPKGAPPAPLPAVAVGSGGERRIDHHAQQSHIALGVPALKRGHPDFFALQLGNYTLGGGGFVSRLVSEVREKRGFAYSVYSYFQPNQELGPFQIGLQTKRAQAGEALALVRQVLADFLKHGPSEDELKAAKANIVGGFALQLDSSRKLLGQVATIGFHGLPLDWLDKYQERMNQVTVADVKAAFARHVPADRLVTVLVAAD